jgi:hypothetical protein
MPTVCVFVRGGVVQDVISDVDYIEVMVVDYDNEADGDSPQEREFFPVTVEPDRVEQVLKGEEER